MAIVAGLTAAALFVGGYALGFRASEKRWLPPVSKRARGRGRPVVVANARGKLRAVTDEEPDA
jgi:hypothetical protein